MGWAPWGYPKPGKVPTLSFGCLPARLREPGIIQQQASAMTVAIAGVRSG